MNESLIQQGCPQSFNEILSNEEISLILKHREQKRKSDDLLLIKHTAVKTLCNYYEWLRAEGRESSFSAFVNEFGYSGENPRHVYLAVHAAIKAIESA